MDQIIDKETAKLARDRFLEDIRRHREAIAQLERAVERFERIISGGTTTPNTNKRLPHGLPKRLVRRTLDSHGPLSIPELKSRIKVDHNVDMQSQTIRSALRTLKDNNEAVRLEDGSWRLLKPEENGTSVTPLGGDDDDLPF